MRRTPIETRPRRRPPRRAWRPDIREDGPAPRPSLSEDQLEDRLSEPLARRWSSCSRRLEGDVLVLGAGGKMGPSLARMAARAAHAAGSDTRDLRRLALRRAGPARSPAPAGASPRWSATWPSRAPSAGCPTARTSSTWPAASSARAAASGTPGPATSSWPARRRAPSPAPAWSPSRPATSTRCGRSPAPEGPDEETPPDPVGEYAQSCLGRERMFEYFSRRNGTLVTLLRLNYAVELRYGVLLDIAIRVWTGAADRSEHGPRQRHLAGRRQRLRPA